MKLLALDGNSIINRAFYGIRLLSTKDGMFTNGIYGFMNILLKLQEEVGPDRIVAAFDLKAPTFRHKLYADYKAGRKPMPDELRVQIPVLKDVLRAFGCVVLEKEGYEADDILGTVGTYAANHDGDCVIATGDRDALQLVGDRVTVMLAATKMGRPEVTVYDTEKIKADYGVTPPEMIEIKALQGDSSDNIPGVPGVGPKTAGTLIAAYHSIDYIYDNIDSLDIKENLRQKLKDNKDSAFLSRRLGTINCAVPLEWDEKTDGKRDPIKLKTLLAGLEMFKLIERLNLTDVPVENAPSQPSAPAQNRAVQFEQTQQLPDNSVIYLDNGVLYAKYGDRFYCVKQNLQTALQAKGLVCHDAKQLYHALEMPFCPDIAFDTMLAAYLLNPDQSDYSIGRFSVVYQIPQTDHKAADALLAIEAMHNDFAEKIKENEQEKLLHDIEIPLAYTLYRMEREGFLVDQQGIETFGAQLAAQADMLQKQIYSIIGYEFNLNSPKQLGVALFEKLGLPHSKKTKTGYSTSAEVLENLRYESDVVEMLLQYRSVTKLKSTYCDGLLAAVQEDGRVHCTFKQTETRTGRLSSTEPNLQNIPVRTELGRQMRKFFTAKDGYVLVDADYSQIELRVLASIANDETMCDAFLQHDDIHAITASQVFHIPLEMMTPDIRSKAKAVNFGIVYGIGAFSLSKDIHVSVAQAKEYIENYLNTYHGVRDYMDNVVKTAKEQGYVTTAFHRRRYLPELTASNFNTRSFGERVAKNMPIQGTAADIIKIAMIRVEKRLEQEKLNAKLIMQVHDELIVEAENSCAERVCQLLKEEMENAVSFRVPMEVEVKSGKTWFDTK